MSKIIKILAALFVVLVIGVIIAISMIDVSQYKEDIIVAVEDTTGRDFNISGELSMAISLVPTVIIEGVTFANADWGTQENMLSVGRLEVKVSLIPLLSGTLQIDRILLDSPEIYLETNSEGVGNWVLDMPESEESGELPSLAVSELNISNASFIYKDGQTDSVTDLSISKIDLSGSGYSSPLQFVIDASYNDNPISLSGELGSTESLLDNDNFSVDLSGNVSAAAISLKGNIDRPMDATGIDLVLTLMVDSLDELNSLADSELPEFGPLSFTGTLKDIDGGYAVNNMAVQAGPNDLAGDLSIDMSGDKPAITAKLTSNTIDLTSDEEAEEEQASESDPNAKVFASDPLPLEGLMAANADISLNAKTIMANAATLTDTSVGIKLTNGNLAISPLNSTVAGGKLISSIRLDGSSGSSARLSIDVDLKGFQPGLLPSMEGEIEGASTDLSLKANGSGASVAAIMAGLNANLLVKTDEGIIKSKSSNAATSNILMEGYKKLNPGSEDDSGGTQLVCSVAKIDIKDGIAEIDNSVALQTSSLNVIGNGMLNFKDETLDLGVEPQAREGLGINMSQLAELVRLKGTFANPSVGTDTKAALKAGLSAGAAVMTGGLSMLAQGLLDKSSAIEDPCAVALGLTPAQAPAQADTATAEAPAESGTPVDAVKDAASGVTNKLKGLFGR